MNNNELDVPSFMKRRNPAPVLEEVVQRHVTAVEAIAEEKEEQTKNSSLSWYTIAALVALGAWHMTMFLHWWNN